MGADSKSIPQNTWEDPGFLHVSGEYTHEDPKKNRLYSNNNPPFRTTLRLRCESWNHHHFRRIWPTPIFLVANLCYSQLPISWFYWGPSPSRLGGCRHLWPAPMSGAEGALAALGATTLVGGEPLGMTLERKWGGSWFFWGLRGLKSGEQD